MSCTSVGLRSRGGPARGNSPHGAGNCRCCPRPSGGEPTRIIRVRQTQTDFYHPGHSLGASRIRIGDRAASIYVRPWPFSLSPSYGRHHLRDRTQDYGRSKWHSAACDGERGGRLLWFAVTRNPTAEWLARQITEAFPWDSAPKYLIRDNDRAFGVAFKARVRAMGIRDRPTSYRSPWQNGYVERLIGSIRRECTDHCVPRTYRWRRRYGAVQKMRVGPSHPAIRSWMQTAASCCR
jgi:hypothetical protein